MKKRVLLVVLAALIGIHIAMPFETKAEPHMNYEGPFEFSVETLYRAGDWGYYLTDANQIVIHQYYGSAETVTVPSALDGKKVVILDDSFSFRVKKLKHLIIPDGIEWVDFSAFQWSKLETLTLGKDVKYAYIGALVSGDYGGENDPFDNIKSLKAFYVDARNPYLKSVKGVLYDKAQKKLFYYPASKKGKTYRLPKTVQEIGIGAFANTKLTEVKLNKNLRIINDGAFSHASIRKIRFNQNLQRIGERAFEYCDDLGKILPNKRLTSVGANAFFSVKYFEKMKGAQYLGNVFLDYVDYDYKHYVMKMPKTIRLKKGTRVIADYAVSTCYFAEDWEEDDPRPVKTLVLPKTVKYIGDYAFAGSDLKSVKIKGSVVSVGEHAFDFTQYIDDLKKKKATTVVNCSKLYRQHKSPLW